MVERSVAGAGHVVACYATYERSAERAASGECRYVAELGEQRVLVVVDVVGDDLAGIVEPEDDGERHRYRAPARRQWAERPGVRTCVGTLDDGAVGRRHRRLRT